MGGGLLLVLHQLHHQPVLLRALQQDLQAHLRPDPLLPGIAQGETPEHDLQENRGELVVFSPWQPRRRGEELGQEGAGDVTEEQPDARGDAQQQE